MQKLCKIIIIFLSYVTKLSDGTEVLVDSFGYELSVGQGVYLEHFTQQDTYNFVAVNRSIPLVLISLLFVIAIIILAGKKGLRSLGGLGLSLVFLLFGLVPMLLAGYDPMWASLSFGLVVLFSSIFLTHGFNYQSLVSFLGASHHYLV